MIQQAGGGAGGKIPVVSYLPTGRQSEIMWSDHSDHSLGTTEQHVCSFYLREQCGDFTKSVITADGWLPRNNIIAGHVNLSNDNLFSVCKTSEDSFVKYEGCRRRNEAEDGMHLSISPSQLFVNQSRNCPRADWNMKLPVGYRIAGERGKIGIKLTSRGFTNSMTESP